MAGIRHTTESNHYQLLGPRFFEEVSTPVERAFDAMAELEDILESQRNGRAYDQLIAQGDEKGNAMVQEAIDALMVQTRGIERAVAALDVTVEIEGGDRPACVVDTISRYVPKG